MEINVFLHDPLFLKKGEEKNKKSTIDWLMAGWHGCQMMWPEAKLLQHTEWLTADPRRKSQQLNDPLKCSHNISPQPFIHSLPWSRGDNCNLEHQLFRLITESQVWRDLERLSWHFLAPRLNCFRNKQDRLVPLDPSWKIIHHNNHF